MLLNASNASSATESLFLMLLAMLTPMLFQRCFHCFFHAALNVLFNDVSLLFHADVNAVAEVLLVILRVFLSILNVLIVFPKFPLHCNVFVIFLRL